MRNKSNRLRIGLKYCGGCNPEYNRVGLVIQLEKRFKDQAIFLPPDDDNVDLILAIHGCATACADLGSYYGLRIIHMTHNRKVAGAVKELNERLHGEHVKSSLDAKKGSLSCW